MRQVVSPLLLLGFLLGAAPTTQPSLADLHAMSPGDFARYAPAKKAFTREQLDVDLLEAAVSHAANEARRKEGLEPLQYSAKLNKIAREHSQEMAELHYFAHESPRPENTALADRLKQVDLVANFAAAENIAVLPTQGLRKGMYTITKNADGVTQIRYKSNGGPAYENYLEFAEANVQMWLHSPGHRKNLLDPNQKFMGLGAARGSYDGQDSVYITQDFASRVGEDDASYHPPAPPPNHPAQAADHH